MNSGRLTMFYKNFVTVFTIIVFLSFSPAILAKKKQKTSDLPKITEASMIVDASTGKVLHSVNGHERIYPASLTKLMTLYLCFDEIKNGKLKLKDELLVSKRAENAKPTKLGLKAGQKITVEDAILGLIVKSANDASVTVAEAISGTEEEFAKKMTKKAKELGMHSTEFYNSSGLHHPNQKTTAYDLARLGLILRKKYPEFYPLFQKTHFEFAGKIVTGHNKVTKNYKGAEGMKTGFTCPSGFNLITTATKEGKTLLGVVTGSPTAKYRDTKMVKLLDKHFSIEPKLAKASETPSSKVTKKIARKDLKLSKKTVALSEKKKPKKVSINKKPTMKKLKKKHTPKKVASI